MAPSAITAGSGEVTTYTCDFRMRATDIQTAKSAVYDQNLHLTYDDAGNITGGNDILNSDNDTYTYDQLNRLTGMSINSVSAASYTYNAIGNMLTKNENTSLTLNYPASGGSSVHPHAMTSTTGSPAYNLTYDANGNMTARDGWWYHYDAENRLYQRKWGSSYNYGYVYDGNGTLVKRTLSAGSTLWTVYIGGIYEKNGDGTTVKYYTINGHTVAVNKAGTLAYMLSDQMGSSTARQCEFAEPTDQDIETLRAVVKRSR